MPTRFDRRYGTTDNRGRMRIAGEIRTGTGTGTGTGTRTRTRTRTIHLHFISVDNPFFAEASKSKWTEKEDGASYTRKLAMPVSNTYLANQNPKLSAILHQWWLTTIYQPLNPPTCPPKVYQRRITQSPKSQPNTPTPKPSPFGVMLENRHFQAEDYRYGFNGMEKDDEVKGSGNSYTTEFRLLDPCIGRWLSIDPEFSDFPWQAPFVTMDNNPLYIMDPTGLSGEKSTTSTVYHNTSVENAVDIIKDGLSKSTAGFVEGGSGWTYFMTDPSGKKASKNVANAEVQLGVEIDYSKAKKISYDQWHKWYIEGLKEIGYTGGDVTDEMRSKADAIRNKKAQTYMKEAGGDLFVIEAEKGAKGQKFVVAKGDALKKASINTIGGRGKEQVLKKLGYRQPVVAESAQAKSKFGSTSNIKYVKAGLKALVVVGIASDVYEIYTSEDKSRTITKIVGGWAGATGGAALGAAITIETGPGALLGGLVGGIVGYFVGSEVTETVYDYFFSTGTK